MAPENAQKIPVFLLKTKSSPGDSYEDLFSETRDGFSFDPIFVPVLRHKFELQGMKQVESLLKNKRMSNTPGSDYGGLIFTSQRAVEAFAKLVEDGKGDAQWPHLQHVPVYSVGPATTRALSAVSQVPPLNVFGEHTGTGDALAQFILEHYAEWYKHYPVKPPLLFMVGETRRDIIPKTLMDETLPSDRRIQVTETVVYGTAVMDSFADHFAEQLETTEEANERWAVVFSPTGCDSMLGLMGLLGDDGKAKAVARKRTTFVATIGPTTRDHLVKNYGFEPDVSAKKPSPEGVLKGIAEFMSSK
ncbi:uroporphyrinogen-III synthase HemD [Zalerion maritima]|uniref:Uroporphyrinogen-III synthase HemD n=1 Tax=Zalerion maritima TaxID=339359 RepID=A0AAD5WUF5_9PEZI|nr:uroporphyrinogen-III synthase HemD [Zalerion maritima]